MTLEIAKQWAIESGSGSLLRAIQEGMAWSDMYVEERTAMEYGYCFEAVHASRLTTGRPIASSDDTGTTKTCWFARRLRYLAMTARKLDNYTVVYAKLSYHDGGDELEREGIAITCEPEVRPKWLGRRLLVAFTTVDGKEVNPC